MQPLVYCRLSENTPVFQPMVESNITSRITEAVKSVGYSLSGAALAIGLSAQASQKWKKGQISDKNLRAIAELTGHSFYWLKDAHGSKTPDQPPLTTTTITIPQYATGGRGGAGLVLQDQPGMIANWTVSREWLTANIPSYSSPDNLYIVTGFGDSMPDTYNPGDPVLIDTGITTCDHDGVYFFRVGNEGFIKRLQRIPTVGIRVLSQNRDYEPWTITPDMDFQVFGKVLKAWKGRSY